MKSAISAVAVTIALASLVAPAFAFRSGDLPAPVDLLDMDGPGRSYLNDSRISGFDGNQGNERVVGKAGGASAAEPEPEPEPSGDGVAL